VIVGTASSTPSDSPSPGGGPLLQAANTGAGTGLAIGCAGLQAPNGAVQDGPSSSGTGCPSSNRAEFQSGDSATERLQPAGNLQ
jgi:hypothetical protein